jgi:hypothetical protein
MPQTWSTFQAALKETWTDDDFETQFYDNHPLLEDIERTDKHTIGEYANVPLLLTRNGGFTVAGTAGSSALNAAGNVGPAQAQYALAYNYQQVKVDHPAIVSSQGSPNAVAAALDTELEGASSMMRTQITRQVYQDQTALICQCAAGGASTTVNLNATTGYDALVKGWLDVSMTVDVGTTASEATIAADTDHQRRQIDSTTPTITIGSSVTTTTSHYVSVANARSGTSSLEMNGLGNIISGSATLGGISATNRWKGYVDSTTTDLTLDSLLAVQEQVQSFTNKVKPHEGHHGLPAGPPVLQPVPEPGAVPVGLADRRRQHQGHRVERHDDHAGRRRAGRQGVLRRHRRAAARHEPARRALGERDHRRREGRVGPGNYWLRRPARVPAEPGGQAA